MAQNYRKLLKDRKVTPGWFRQYLAVVARCPTFLLRLCYVDFTPQQEVVETHKGRHSRIALSTNAKDQ
jgi:hypothetical protein